MTPTIGVEVNTDVDGYMERSDKWPEEMIRLRQVPLPRRNPARAGDASSAHPTRIRDGWWIRDRPVDS